MQNLFQIFVNSPLGSINIISSDRGIKQLVIPSEDKCGSSCKAINEITDFEQPWFLSVLCEQLIEYFKGNRIEFAVPVDVDEASTFNQMVWNCTRRIPFGMVKSYSEVARLLGMPGAARAVGQALARNPVPIIIPCHRVIYANGKLGGFAGTASFIKTKIRLLSLEGHNVSP